MRAGAMQNEHPLHALRLDGRSCAVHASTEQYEAIERQEGLIPWQGGPGGGDNLIDRFDGRAMLDMYVPPRPGVQRPKTDEEVELEEVRGGAAGPTAASACTSSNRSHPPTPPSPQPRRPSRS